MKRHPELRGSVILATKFGEKFDEGSGRTSVDLTAAAADKCLEASERLMGHVDVFYSHVTSQVSSDVARSVLQDEALTATLIRMRDSGRVSYIGTSVSHTDVVLEGVERGWFKHLDVIQLPAPLVLEHPDVAKRLESDGKVRTPPPLLLILKVSHQRHQR